MLDILLLRLKIFIAYFRDKSDFYLELSSSKKNNIYVFLGADYGNIGDVAITYAQIKYLKERYYDYNVVEIPISKTFAGIKAVRSVITKKDIIVLIGGGNTSDLYDDIEWLRQLVILNFRSYKIIGFPQTFDFTNTLQGVLCRKIASFVYRRAKNILIFAREQNTMNVLNKYFKGIKVALVPDIVMTLDLRFSKKRKGVLICMRSDKESMVDNKQKNRLIQKLKSKYTHIEYQDTQVDDVDTNNRFTKFQEIVTKFRNHELVVTDRLHGMIFCYITGTPALVYDNSNHKISGCFNWIKDCGYIKLIDSLDDIDTFEPIDNFESSHNNIISCYNKVFTSSCAD